MALKDILVVVDDGEAAAHRVAYAAQLADQRDAHLTGLYVTAAPNIPAYVMAQLPEEARAIQVEEAKNRLEAARNLFEQSVEQAGLKSRSEWMAEKGVPAERVALLGRYADLVVAGQDEPEPAGIGHVSAAELVLAGGRPVLVVPYTFRDNGVGRHVLVAWNGSREAARAVADAMPILEAADRVSVLAVDPGDALGDIPGADIAHHLARHGISVEASRIGSQGLDPADVLLNRVADLSADMIVMGAYGRSRLRELVLGGVTHDILRHMTVPVLMSH